MKKVMLLTRAMIPSAVLCGDTQLRLLAERGEIEYRWASPLLCRGTDLDWADVLVFLRSDDDASLLMAKTARRAGKYCVYVLDDDLLNIPGGLDSSAHYARQETKDLIRSIMAQCQCFLSPSRVLLEKYGGAFARAERIEEPALPLPPAEERPRDGVVRIGFAGSIDRAGDVDLLLTEALLRLLDRYADRVSLTIFGARPVLAEDPRVRFIPFQDSYDLYRETMAGLHWDIGLAPMAETEFSRCKHYNKFVEYASCGIAGVYSDVVPYRFAVRHGENGLLAENTAESWYAALCSLVEDDALRATIRENCLREAGDSFSPEATAETWSRVIREAEIRPSLFPASSRIEAPLFRDRVRWVFHKLREWGWRTPFKLAEKLVKLVKRLLKIS